MKDYTLSEAKKICEEHRTCGDCPLKIITPRGIGCMLGVLPISWHNPIEPRDMVDLPSIQKYEWVYPEASRNCVSYDVIYRDSYGQIQIVQDFDDEARAYAFLKMKKGGKV